MHIFAKNNDAFTNWEFNVENVKREKVTGG
jgi:hypothetical protein